MDNEYGDAAGKGFDDTRLPTEGFADGGQAVTEAEMEEARAWLRDKLAERFARHGKKKYSQAVFAKEMNTTPTIFCSFMSGKYPSPETVMEKYRQFRNYEENRGATPEAPAYVMTSVSEIVYGRIAHAHIKRQITISYGDAGIGKTMAIHHFADDFPDAAIVITADPACESVAGLYDMLAGELRIGENSCRRIQAEALRLLKHSNRVIIVDEAQLLKTKQIEALRIFAGRCEIGLALVGNHAIYTKMVGSGRQEYAQMFNRIADGDDAPLLNSSIKWDDVGAVFSGRNLDERSLALLHKIASKTNYGLRGAVNVYMKAAQAYGGAVTYERLELLARKKVGRQ